MASELICLPYQCSFSHTLSSNRSPLKRLLPPRRAYSLANPRPSPLTCAVSTQDAPSTQNRKSANYQPNLWTYDFLQSLENNLEVEKLQERARELEKEVRRMMNAADTEPLSLLELIDNVQRLGLTYKFEEDINRALNSIVSLGNLNYETEKSLYATALSFRLLRQHGFDVSQDVFNNFKDNEGKFKSGIGNDVLGMLSLYEASHLAFEGESLLDEAKAFSRTQLQNLKEGLGTNMAEKISHVLELPYHQRLHRLETRWYIDTHDKKEIRNSSLLELAKLDFNMVQTLHQQELRDMSRWWKEVGLATKLSFARDRLMESFFWSLCMVPDAQFNKCRKQLTKVAKLITVLDDVYDVYGTLDELELFTDAVQRWDVNAIETLPDYMKLCFFALYNTINDMAYDSLKEQGQNSLPYLTKAWADLFKSFLQEAKWTCNNVTPSFEEYLENGWVSSSGGVFLTHSFFLLGQDINEHGLDSLTNYHDLLRSPCIIFRLCNDLATSTAEIETGKTTNSIACYMGETGASEEQARQYLRSLIDKSWKKINKARVVDSKFSKDFKETCINLARIAQCTYQYGDGHGRPDSRSRNRIKSLIVEPISLNATR